MKKIPQIVKKIQKHTLKEINYSTEKQISYSQISMFLDCPHKWALQYRDGHYQSQSSIHMTFGTALHNAIQHYITTIYEVSGVEADKINLEEYFEENFRETYLKDYKSNNKVHFSDPVEMREFYEDGLEILKFIRKKRGAYFGKRGWYLVGCEISLLLNPNPKYKNILFKGFLDVVLYHEPTNTFKIIDIKTSKSGWNNEVKKNKIKQLQLIAYKKYYSQQFDIPEDNISVEFFIVKRKVWEDSPYPISRIQEFIPPSGKVSMNKAINTINSFIEEVFNGNGTHKDKIFEPNPSLHNCKFCPFRNKKELCSKGIS